MAKKTTLSDADIKLFRNAMRNVTPLIQTTKITPSLKETPLKRRKQPILDEANEHSFPFCDFEKLSPVDGDAILSFSKPGISYKILRKMRAGQYTIGARLDLHGMSVDEARESLSQFILKCKRNSIRHVLMIHGKGLANNKPILKNKLNHWLRQTNDVLAFCSALPKDGKSGALYVLLRG